MEAERPNCKMAQPANRRRQHFRSLKLATDGDVPEERNRCAEESPSSPTSSCSSIQSSLFCSDASMCADAEETKKMLSACISHGWVSVIGRRKEMEDTVAVEPGFFGVGEYDFYGVYDGHGGVRVAEACREKMHVVIAEEAEAAIKGQRKGEEVGWTRALAASFERLDGEVARKDCAEAVEKSVGSTAVVAIVGRRQIVVANCGDSRAVLSRGRVAIALSDDHKPNRPDELERVEAAGGRIINWDGYRVLGVLATSRSIGDYYLKPYVTSEPEITVTQRSDKDEFLILATDALWDVVSNESACRIARQCLSGHAAKMFPTAVYGRSAAEAAALLAQHAIARGSKDNISVVVVELARLDERKRRSNVKA